MAPSSTGFASYMAENIPTSRWELYRLRFLCFFFMFMLIGTNAMAMVFDHPARVLVTALAFTLGGFALQYLTERYEPRHQWAFIGFWLVLLAVVVAIAWHGIEKHRQNERMNSNPTTIHP
jgi:peptidoglycan biosynthesis protein MviN/MurJ (putative lipid II flippase)